ncbi:hypothetical protein CYMTET_45265 [Cymbomonas tetramitiformis]|uniref:Uncharacterized protein n=1 Tax=Cymbomonas tetramitiformis TaxID=36881 RepID=A0AAE0EYR9_9CHLO|nr:hypothetical protein CYMTET_45265 [Cymbomonas tetramitiformis]
MNTSSWSENLKGLADNLSREREQREISVNLEYGISDVTSGFSHFCLRGLRTLISIVREASTEPRTVQNLQVLQRKDSALRLVPLIMREILADDPRAEIGRDGRRNIPVGISGSTGLPQTPTHSCLDVDLPPIIHGLDVLKIRRRRQPSSFPPAHSAV